MNGWNIMRRSGSCLLGCYLACLCFLRAQPPAGRVHERLAYLSGLLERRAGIDLPVIRYRAELPANARYQHDTIWLGMLQQAYHTRGDTLSILYHEYLHAQFEEEGRFPLALDSLGEVPQWDTGEGYLASPDSLEVELIIARYRARLQAQRPPPRASYLAAQLQQLRADLARPSWHPFVYAPSNLAREELAAYQAQLAGEARGYYRLSASARQAIQLRLRQLRATLQRRQTYEHRHGLNPDGSRSP